MNPDNQPVLIGAGVASRREADHSRALEPLALMLKAVEAAGADCGTPAALNGVGYVSVPRGRWAYRNPAGAIARAIGAPRALTVLSTVGVLQQSLIGEACEAIAQGDVDCAIVAGADAGHRILRARIAGAELADSQQDDDPDVLLRPVEELRHPAELQHGLQMPVGLYAILESAWRAHNGWTPPEHRDRLAAQGARLSAVAAANPHAWDRRGWDAAAIAAASAANPSQAHPYNRAHCSTWNVDQASALLLCSVARARELGVPEQRWVWPVVSTEANHMVPVSARARLAECPGAALAGAAALDWAGLGIADVDLVDLYSCFPFAVEVFAAAIALPHDRDATITGGMAFAGGPYNNYLLQATARAVELLRAGQGRTALLSCVSGIVTKQGFGLWSLDRPRQGFARRDLTCAAAAQMPQRPVLANFQGTGRIAGYTVLEGRNATPRAVALLDTPDGSRALFSTSEPATVADMLVNEWVGRTIEVPGGGLAA